MRIVDYRAWDEDNEKFWFWDSEYLDNGTSFWYGVRVLEHIPQQYTGMKDRNGKKIFQDDIIKSSVGIINVIWVKEIASFGLRKSGWMHTHYFKEALEPGDCEIIGNKHENPDLWKRDK